MAAFLWTMLVLLVLEAIARAIWLARGELPPRTRGATVVDLIGGVVLAGWAIALLARGA